MEFLFNHQNIFYPNGLKDFAVAVAYMALHTPIKKSEKRDYNKIIKLDTKNVPKLSPLANTQMPQEKQSRTIMVHSFFVFFCHQKPCSCEDLPKAIRYYSLVLQFSLLLVLGFWYINVLSALLNSRKQIFVFPLSLTVIEHRTQPGPQLQSHSIQIRHKASLQSTPTQICNAYFSQHQIGKAESLKFVIMNHRNIKGFRRLKT